MPQIASAQTRCTQETLVVRTAPLSVRYCVQGPARSVTGDEAVIPVVATYGAAGGSFTRTLELHFVAGERVSRVLESLDLRQVGIAGTLHLTLAYAAGVVRVEGAMLTPGAITVKCRPVQPSSAAGIS